MQHDFCIGLACQANVRPVRARARRHPRRGAIFGCRLVLPEQQPEQAAERGGGQYGFGDEFDGGAELFHGVNVAPGGAGFKGRRRNSPERIHKVCARS